MKTNPLKTLTSFGQSIWLDFISKELITSGQLNRLIKEDYLRGMTSNPAIFEKAILESHSYEDEIKELAQQGKSANEIYEAITQHDVRMAADEFLPVFKATDGVDGYVSLEVNPHLAHDTEGTITEARRLWKSVNRPNVFIKVPGTVEGLPAIKLLLSEGININITLLFGLPRYRQVAEAYISALETRDSKNKPVKMIASVASFFLSRIDVLLDPKFEQIAAKGGEDGEIAKKLVGQVAIASAIIAYQMYKEIFGNNRFKKLADKGTRPQRVLWASTSTKNPKYSDVKYVESLIGSNTVNTIPLETLEAYKDHGKPHLSLEKGVEHARWVLAQLPALGIDIDKITQQLEDEGIKKFNDPYDKLISSIEKAASGQATR